MKRRVSQGMSLATTLVVMAVAVTLTFALATTSVYHLSTATKLTNLSQAEGLAESVLGLAIERVTGNVYYGHNRLPEETLLFKPESDTSGGMVASLSFHQPTAAAAGYPYSTNNLTGDAAVEGWDGRVVPVGTVHLVGQGEVQGVQRTVEAILHVPGFRYAIASSGTFSSNGNLLVAGIHEDEDISDGADGIDLHKLLPGHILSNSPENDAGVNKGAIKIGADSKITGDLQSPGGIVLDESVQVLGEVNRGAEEEAIPVISIDALDPKTLKKSNIQYINTSTIDGAYLSGWVRAEDDLVVTGGLHLDGGAVFVDGDLVVEGGIHGTGAVIVDGTTTVTGGSSLESDSALALISDDDIILKGDSADSSYFQGLIYTEGNFTADEVTIVGTFIANGDDSEVTVSNANFLDTGGDGEVKFEVSNPLGDAFYFSKHGGDFIGTNLEKKKAPKIWIRRDTVGLDTFTIYEPMSGQRLEGLSPLQARNQILLWLGGLCCSNHNTEDFTSTEASMYAAMSALMTPDQMAAANLKEEMEINPSSFLKFEEQLQLLLWKAL